MENLEKEYSQLMESFDGLQKQLKQASEDSETKSLRFQMLIKPWLKEALKKEAEENNESMNEMLNIILTEHFRHE